MPKFELTNMIMIQNPVTKDVLVQKRKKYWCGITFPGGHIENGESIYDSAVREAKEETGLTVKNLKYCGVMHWYNTENHDRYFVHFYKTDEYCGELLKRTDEGDVFFTSLDELQKMELSPNFDKYLPMFLSDEHSEIFCKWNEQMKMDVEGQPQWNFEHK